MEPQLIPNVIHFMYFFGPNSRPFAYINYLAVKVAKDVQKPDNIYFYYNEEPKDNPHWEAMKAIVTMVKVDPPTEIDGIELKYPQYQADVYRLQMLRDHGGIYLDTDTFLLKPLTGLMENMTTMGVDQLDESGSPKSVGIGVIVAKKGDRLFDLWLSKIPEYLKTGVWSSHAVDLPLDLWESDKNLFNLILKDRFTPFGWEDKYILGNDKSKLSLLSQSYAVHMWNTIWASELNLIDEAYMQESDSLFANLFRKHVPEKKRLKICVYAISKNEGSFVDKFCDSAKDADLIMIADTGSTDDTVAKARARGVYVSEICISPWRFDKARDAAMALIPRDVDVCISLDLDEIMEPGWREEIERVWKKDTTRLRYKFDWGCGISFYYEKIHARSGYHWHHPCHEYPRADARIKEVYAYTDMLMVSHHPDPTKSRGQYLDLLSLAVAEDPRCPRNAFYYARELTFYGKWDEAVEALNKYLAMPEATWENERCYAMRLLGRTNEELGRWDEAMKWFRKSIAEASGTREPWVDLAMHCYRRQMWHDCHSAAMSALRINDKQLVYTCDPEVWGWKTHDLAAISAWHLGLKDTSIQQGKEACRLAPDDARLAGNLRFYIGEEKIAA
jgi:hypothetical protein